MKNLQGYFDTLLEETPSSFHRYMFNRIDWDNRLIGLVGPRGVGKTTLMLQHAKEELPRHSTLFVTAEDMYFASNNLVELAADFAKKGGRYLIIDENEIIVIFDGYNKQEIKKFKNIEEIVQELMHTKEKKNVR